MKVKTGHIALGAGVLVVGGLLYRLNRTAKNLEVIPRLRIQKIDFRNLTIAVDTTLKNPTAGGLKINFPFVKLTYEDQTIGSSQAKEQEIKIPPFGQAEIRDIMIEVPILNLSGIAVGMLDYLRGKTNEVEIGITVMTQADALLTSFPVSITEKFTIKRSNGSQAA